MYYRSVKAGLEMKCCAVGKRILRKIDDENCNCKFIASGMQCFVRKTLQGQVYIS